MKTTKLILSMALIFQLMPAISANKAVTIAERKMPAYEALSILNEQCDMDVDEGVLADSDRKIMIALDGVDCDVALDLIIKVNELKSQNVNNEL